MENQMDQVAYQQSQALAVNAQNEFGKLHVNVSIETIAMLGVGIIVSLISRDIFSILALALLIVQTMLNKYNQHAHAEKYAETSRIIQAKAPKNMKEFIALLLENKVTNKAINNYFLLSTAEFLLAISVII